MNQKKTKKVDFFPNKFADIPTREIRVKAVAFGFEKFLFPEATLRNRIREKKILEEISKKEIGTSEKSVLDERTWRGWLKGNIKRPQLLSSFCCQLAPEKWPEKFLKLDNKESPVLLLLHSLDVLLLDPSCKKNSKSAYKKIELARNILRTLEFKWTVKSGFNQLFIQENWLHPNDTNRIAKSHDFLVRTQIKKEWSDQIKMRRHPFTIQECVENIGIDAASYSLKFGGCRSLPSTSTHPDRIEFILNKDVCGRFEIETPLKFLQFMLRMSLYLEEGSEFPINTYSLDLLSAAIATHIFYNWYDDGISGQLSSGSIVEAIDSTLKFLCHGQKHVAAYLLHTAAPWGRMEKFSEDKITENLTAVRQAYMSALHEFGITQSSIKRLIADVETILISNDRES